nr:fimbria/pilus outer membrane usher protein [Rhodanobacter glycinis]
MVVVISGWPGSVMANGAAAAANPAGPAAASGADANANFADFDRSLLAGAGSNTTDLSRFEHGNPVLPGIYNLDVYLNDTWVGRTDVRFAAASPKASATACVTRKLLDQLGLRPAKLAETLQTRLQDPAACVNIGEVIPGSTTTLDMSTLRLDTSVPQAYLGQTPRDYVSPEYWDQGVPAALLNYNLNSYHNSSRGLSQTSTYLGLNAGLNIGLWHVRQDSTVNWQSGTANAPARREWHNIDAYVQRDLPSLRSLLTIGDSYTDGSVFDSHGLRGVQLATDDRMLPNSLRGYAPIIRGVANTNAKVTVRQNGVQIYQTTVAPGPFTIKDLYPTGYGGNLDVTVTEADGHVRTFSVPYASVAQLLRPGITRYDIAIGQLRNVSLQHKPNVVQATVQHGFNNFFTGYAGLVGSQGYAAALLGGAINTRYGALALDVTQAGTRIPGYKAQDGQSIRLTYSKIIPSTQTSLSVAAYRYSTSGYLSLGDAAIARDYARRGLDALQYVPPTTVPMIDGLPVKSLLTPAQQAALSGSAFTTNPILAGVGLQRRRNNFTLTLSQRLGQSAGSLYANGSISDYWNRNGTDTQFQIGYNNSFHRLSYNLSAARTRDPFGHYDNEYMLSFNLPLGDSAHAPTFSLNVNRSDSGGSQDQAMVSGTLGANSQFNYGATATHSSDGNGNAGTLNAGYRSPYAIYSASYGKGQGYSQSSVGISGAIVAHPGGITFGQPIGDTVAIVHVPDAAGASINSAPGVSVGRSGYALVPYLTPYQLNTIQIDPRGLPLSVQLDATSAQVAPYAGAVVMVDFMTKSGRSLIAHIQRADGSSLPFGTEVLDAHGQAVGTVGQGGLALLRVASMSGQLGAQWQGTHGATHSCAFAYTIPAPSPSEHGQPFIDATCAASGQAASQQRGGQ